jgi:hypothetical protein
VWLVDPTLFLIFFPSITPPPKVVCTSESILCAQVRRRPPKVAGSACATLTWQLTFRKTQRSSNGQVEHLDIWHRKFAITATWRSCDLAGFGGILLVNIPNTAACFTKTLCSLSRCHGHATTEWNFDVRSLKAAFHLLCNLHKNFTIPFQNFTI